jgi:hypothetical protein
MNDTIKTEKLEPLTSATMSEAPASLNFFAITEKGWNLQITLRDVDEFNLLKRFAKLAQHLESMHVTPKQVGHPAAQTEAVKSNGTTAAEGAVTFQADKLITNVSEGKTAFKVKGGKYSKFGVTIYPEVLAEAGFDVDLLDPTKVIDLKGYTAHVIMDGDKAVKVSKLVKA